MNRNNSRTRLQKIKNKKELTEIIDNKYKKLNNNFDMIMNKSSQMTNNSIKEIMNELIDFLDEIFLFLEACVPFRYARTPFFPNGTIRSKKINNKKRNNSNKIRYDIIRSISSSIRDIRYLIRKYTLKPDGLTYSSAFSTPEAKYDKDKVLTILKILSGTFGMKNNTSTTPIKKVALNRAINLIKDDKLSKNNGTNKNLSISNYSNQIKNEYIKKGNLLKRFNIIYKIIRRLLENEKLVPELTPQEIANQKEKLKKDQEEKDKIQREQQEIINRQKSVNIVYNEINKSIQTALRSISQFEAHTSTNGGTPQSPPASALPEQSAKKAKKAAKYALVNAGIKPKKAKGG